MNRVTVQLLGHLHPVQKEAELWITALCKWDHRMQGFHLEISLRWIQTTRDSIVLGHYPISQYSMPVCQTIPVSQGQPTTTY